MAVVASAVERPSRAVPVVGVLAALAAVTVHAVLATRFPIIDLGLAALCAFAFFPPLCRATLIAAVAVGPTLNPTLLGLGPAGGGTVAGGRLYLIQAVLILIVAGALVFSAYNGLHGAALTIGAIVALLFLIQTAWRPDAGPAWVYRPFQIFLVAFAVRSLFDRRDHRGLLLAAAWGSGIGCALATVHALVPAVDPFAISRPDNLPFVSAIGNFARATGAFTYPNNLGTFAAYTALLGAASLLLGRPALPRPLAAFLVGSGAAALLLSGSRAAGFGLLCGLLYVTAKLAPRRRALILAAEAMVGLTIVLAILSNPSAAEVAQQRLDSAAGESLALRIEGSRAALDAFLTSPVIGTGASEARTDNFWLLYLFQAGLAGAVLYVLLARRAFGADRPDKAYPELWAALLIALGSSGLLQDSLGQTLVTWFPGVLLGICALARPPHRADDEPLVGYATA